MVTIFVHRDGRTEQVTRIDRAWLMNVPLPRFPGGEAGQFWWLFGIMAGTIVAMLAMFRRKRWI